MARKIYNVPKWNDVKDNITFGFESTWKYPNESCFDKHKVNYGRLVEFIEYNTETDKLKFVSRIDKDEANIEIPSIVYKTKDREQFIFDYKKLRRRMSMFGLVESSNSKQWNTEGGGHIHLGFPAYVDGFMDIFIDNIYRFQYRYPQIGWLFNSAYDNYNKIPKEKSSHRFVNIVPRENTIEFRLFIMPKNLNEFNLHLDFALAVYKYCYEISARGSYVKVFKKQRDWRSSARDYRKIGYTEIPYEDSIKDMKDMFSDLGLDFGRAVKCGKLDMLWTRYNIVDKKGNNLKSEYLV